MICFPAFLRILSRAENRRALLNRYTRPSPTPARLSQSGFLGSPEHIGEIRMKRLRLMRH
jgi:hypothetical protein